MTLYDIAYGTGLGVAAPIWLLKGSLRRKVLQALKERMGESGGSSTVQSGPAIMIHAVSNGELGATTSLIKLLSEARPDLRFIVSTTTATGWERSRELYGANPRVTRVRYPLDFSSAVRRTLDAHRPDLVVLMELEVWPNFLDECRRRDIPVILANGRITESSFRGYSRIRWITAAMFRQLAAVCAQDQNYADRFLSLGARPDRVEIVGTMKFDTAHLGDKVNGDDALAAAVGIAVGSEPVWVCGSTGPGEEEIILDAYQRVLERHPRLRLVIVPRHKPRFDEVANLIAARGFEVVRRSRPSEPIASRPPKPPVILGDTMGELRTFYSLASIVFVGRSLVDLGPRQHGSDMIEPAALAKPVIVGPFTHNFAEPVNYFRAADAIKVVTDMATLAETTLALLDRPDEAKQIGLRAQNVVRGEQGATQRHVEIILGQLDGARAART